MPRLPIRTTSNKLECEDIALDAKVKGLEYTKYIKVKRGKFKISENQFKQEIEECWLTAECSALERVMDFVSSQKELSREDLLAHCHIVTMGLLKTLEHMGKIKSGVKFDHIVNRYS